MGEQLAEAQTASSKEAIQMRTELATREAQLRDLQAQHESRLKENWSSETVSQQARERVAQLEAALESAERTKEKAIADATALKQAEADNARLALEHVKTKLEQ